MTISKLRHYLYKAARVLSDVSAVQHHRIRRRVENRAIGRLAGKVLRKLWR
jgi:hypothetical protein